MKRIMSMSMLNELLDIVEKQKDEHIELYDYLSTVKRTHNTLYSVHRDGAVCLQMHRSTFESTRCLPINEPHDL